MTLPRKVRMVKGPAWVTVRGRCSVLGADVSNSIVAVRAGKALPFEPRSNCRIHVRMSRGARAWWANVISAGTLTWEEPCHAILQLLHRKPNLAVLVIGDGDTGKSTFCTYLANLALKRGVEPCIVDGDIG